MGCVITPTLRARHVLGTKAIRSQADTELPRRIASGGVALHFNCFGPEATTGACLWKSSSMCRSISSLNWCSTQNCDAWWH